MMLVAIAASFQLAIAAPERTSITVKDGSRTATVALVSTQNGPILRPDQLKPIVPITVSHLTNERWLLIINGTAIEVEQGNHYVRTGDQTFQLAGTPDVRKQMLFVPLQLIAEVVPRVATNLIWDADRYELRAFSAPRQIAVEPPPRASGPPASGPPRAERPRAQTSASSPATALGELKSRHLVVVDAGHGGPDGGMHGPIGGGAEIHEKNVTLDVAKRVGSALNQLGIDVKYTRTTDTLIALSDRGRIANDAHADLFVSIHVNAANPHWNNPGGSRGFETYFLAEAKTEDARRVEQMENEVVKFESGPSSRAGDPLSFIINDMAQNEHLRESNELAELIQRRIAGVHPGPSRGVKQAGFRVLVTAFMPAVLVEIGFGTNPAESQYLTDSGRMDTLAAAISDAVVEYLKRYERRVTTSGGGAAGPH